MFEICKIKSISGTGIPLRGNNIDTDRIIPARFLKCVTFDSLGGFVFCDERFDENNIPKQHPFNEEKYHGGSILTVNKNFGCGSSREHAPQALLGFGIRAIIGESYAEIFRENCTAVGIVLMTASEASVEKLMSFIEESPNETIFVDVENSSALYGGSEEKLDIPESSRIVLTEGLWDSTSRLLRNEEAIRKTARNLPYLNF